MYNIKVDAKAGKYDMLLPTNLDEITDAYLKRITSNVDICPDYSLIGVVYREKLSTILLAARRKTKETDIPVIPIFIKCGQTNNDFINSINIKQKLIIAPSQIMMGHHVNVPQNSLTINNILALTDGDNKIYQDSLLFKHSCYFIEFKLVPNCDIHGVYNKVSESYKDPFITKIDESNN